MSARLLAAADAFVAMCEPRPHRPALGPERAAEVLSTEANAGRLDPDAVTAVVEAIGLRAPRLERPAGLTERETEVVAMLARGLQTRQVAPQARDLGEDGRSPRPERIRQDRCVDPCCGDAVRDGAWPPRMGRTPDWAAARRALGSSRERSATRRAVSQARRTHGERDDPRAAGAGLRTPPRHRRRRSRPAGRSGGPRSRRSRRRSANGCCASSIHRRETRSSSLRQGSATPASRRPRSSVESGRVITSDVSPAMLDAARRRGAELGLGNIDYRVINAETSRSTTIRSTACSVDSATC